MALTMQQTTLDYNMTNSTKDPRTIDEEWALAYNILLIIITIVIMFSMGSAITFSYLKVIIVKPVGPIIGAVCQLLIMPACCCGYALALSLPNNIAIGMILVGSTPGGSISNIITFWSKADVILSVVMTTISTTLAIGFLPLNMFIYSRFWVDDVTKIPYLNMVITVLYLWASVILGYLTGRKWPKTIPYFTKIGSILALVLILVSGVVQGKVYTEAFDHIWQTYVASVTMPVIGFLIGFMLSWIFCLGLKQRLAIGFETGIQNTAMALTIIAITFPDAYEASYYSQFVILYTTFQVVLGIGTVVGIWVYNFIRYRETPCTTKDSAAFTDDAQPDPSTSAIEGTTRRRTVIDDDDDKSVMVIRVTSVVLDNGQLAVVDEEADATSSTIDKDTGVSSISGSVTGDVESGKDDASSVAGVEAFSVLVVDSGEKASAPDVPYERLTTDSGSTNSGSPLDLKSA